MAHLDGPRSELALSAVDFLQFLGLVGVTPNFWRHGAKAQLVERGRDYLREGDVLDQVNVEEIFRLWTLVLFLAQQPRAYELLLECTAL